MRETDILIIGGGIAGAGAAYFLSSHARVTLVEAEAQAGYHTTGRSAAFYAETYGGPKLQPLTTASKPFFVAPPEGYTDVPLVGPRGEIQLFREDERTVALKAFADKQAALPAVRMIDRDEVLALAPFLDGSRFAGAIYDPECRDLDVAALHQGYLRGLRKAGGDILLDAGVESLRREGGRWIATTRAGEIAAPVIVNAAGAWADKVAAMAGLAPLGIMPLRRTIVTIENPGLEGFRRAAPVTMDIGENWYFKPEGEGFLLSPADETPSEPCDAQPEMEDVALAIDSFEKAVGASVSKLRSKWAGLRSFAPDRAPVIGFDPRAEGFFWSAGQGGFGIQTSPAWSATAACLLRGVPLPDAFVAAGVDPEVYAPARLIP
ncbi:NAD(P)/FAD-dependent oxidoreductase [Gimibacter soli]|uniref:FAD-binding oxidoreductase n=1 Tax=Gimibacter soli TaxID=3024400 RepID=A0AAF0BM54_9PROT|nr:FAD-binding oxidoreductase [Gimibacter soli]WCL55067.1 FAD-binding oxidoreductase [Gimibacter soli]